MLPQWVYFISRMLCNRLMSKAKYVSGFNAGYEDVASLKLTETTL